MYNVAFWGETKQIKCLRRTEYVGKNVPGCYFVLLYFIGLPFWPCFFSLLFWPCRMSVQKCRNVMLGNWAPCLKVNLTKVDLLTIQHNVLSLRGCDTLSLSQQVYCVGANTVSSWGVGTGCFLKSFLLVEYKFSEKKLILCLILSIYMYCNGSILFLAHWLRHLSANSSDSTFIKYRV